MADSTTLPMADSPAHPRRFYQRAAVLAALLLAARLPFLNHPIPANPDEFEFLDALGFASPYPVHYPGYLLWVGLGTLSTWVGFNPYESYQVWSVLGSVLMPVLLYAGLRRRLDDDLAWWLGMALGLSPLLWFTGSIILNHAASGAAGAFVLVACIRAIDSRKARDAVCAACLLAAAIWLRPDLILWLGLPAALAAYRCGPRAVAVSALVVLVSAAAMYASTKYVYERGPAWAVGPNSNHTRELVLATSVFRAGLVDGALRNAIKLVVFLAWAYGTGTLLLAPALFWASRVRSGRAVLGVVALWTVPMVLFLIVFHIAEPGYVMLLLPAGYAILGAGLQSRFGPRIATRVVIVLALASCAQFLFYPWSPDLPRTGGRLASIRSLVNAKVAYMSASGLRNIDLRDRIHQPGDFWRTGAHDVADGLRATPSSRPD